MTQLHKRNPDVYTNDKCPTCNQIESVEHIFTAHGRGEKIYQTYITQLTYEITSHASNKIHININERIQQIVPASSQNIKRIYQGIQTYEVTRLIRKYAGDQSNTVMRNTHKATIEQCKQIWRERNEIMNIWENTQGITKTDKKSKNKNNTQIDIDLEQKERKMRRAKNMFWNSINRYIKHGTQFFDTPLYINSLWTLV